jgi:2-oxoglutarate dehydrogenase E2 component (dihydrolipoamide succinyltransferase)
MSIVEMRVPTIGESVTEVTLSQWLKGNGEFVNLDDPICEFESDKATLEFPAEASGKLVWVAAEGDDLAIGALVAKIDTSVSASKGGATSPSDSPAAKKESAPAPVKETASAPVAVTKETYASGHPSPAAAKVMREHNIAATEVAATGKDGRITQEDALRAISNKTTTTSAPVSPEAPKTSNGAPAVATITANSFSRTTSTKKMTRMRRTIAKRLVSAKNNTAMLTTFNEVDLTNIMDIRTKYQDEFVKKHGIKLGFMSLFAKACAKVLMDMPDVNAQINGEELLYHDYADISIAISTPDGLVVPPVKNVESMKLHEIELAIKALADKARDGKLTLEEMAGGTFTITNGGVFGSMMSTPILNEPQSAILGMHTIQQRPMAINGEVKIRPMMYLALSYDHRVIDGSSSVTFLVKVKQLLEDPIKYLPLC